jgi:tetratricopeptide (TPR) repeat protein
MRTSTSKTLLAIFAAAAFASANTGAAFAAGGSFDSSPPQFSASDFEQGRAAIEKKDWKTAITHLDKALAKDRNNADIQSYLGFAHRNNGNWDEGIKFYRSALAINPNHKGANEYLGQAYLNRGNVALAEEQLAKLEKICGGTACNEYKMLATSVAEYKKSPK